MAMRRFSFLSVALLCGTHTAVAGMPSFDLSDAVTLRLQDISFFLVLLLACGGGMKLLWNFVFKEFSSMPRLTYGRALGLTTLLGLTLLLVLSMISGARELLTPEAWRKQGSTYRLNHPANEEIRVWQLAQLRAVLWEYAEQNSGNFPPHEWVPEIPEKLWHADENGTFFIYMAGHQIHSAPDQIIAAEPVHFGDMRYVLLADGSVKRLPTAQIRQALGIKERL